MHTRTQLPPFIACKRSRAVLYREPTHVQTYAESSAKQPQIPRPSAGRKKLDDAATRALDYYLKPKPALPPEPDNTKLFIVAPHIDTETLLANASEDLLSISTIAADLVDDVDDSRRCVALAISRMADGVQLLVERALDHLETKEMAASGAKG
ncbi:MULTISPECIES: DUF6124 family protein [Pseudomonas]|uniref:DUF6124 family protein n=1 Tax=Pseudomonas TaxID=286 RepID=UPI001F3B0EF3|nr:MULTISPECIES: DUF6124 family protein [Pseudomonas]WHS53886.1 DUF6124 family protein [Pseudomonas brassicacearum]